MENDALVPSGPSTGSPTAAGPAALDTPQPSASAGPATPETFPPSPAELRARRWLIGGLIACGLFLIGLIVLLVFLSISAYQAAVAGVGPTPGEIVVGLLRDTGIIFVAFETLLIGMLMIILIVQVNSLIVLLRDEIRPMLEAVNETAATVRGTTQFVSHNVVTPVMKLSSYLAGLRGVLREIAGLHQDAE